MPKERASAQGRFAGLLVKCGRLLADYASIGDQQKCALAWFPFRPDQILVPRICNHRIESLHFERDRRGVLNRSGRRCNSYRVTTGWRSASPASRVAAPAGSLENKPDNQQSARQEGRQLRILVEP